MLCYEPIYTVLLNFYYCMETSFYFFQALHYVRRSDYQGKPLSVSSYAVSGGTLIPLVPILIYLSGLVLGTPSQALVDLTGTVCLWISNLVFVISRLPQMYEAWLTKSVAGISAMMYITLIIGNVFSGSSILIKNIIDQDPLWKMLAGSSAAIFIGTFGPVSLDIVYLYQMWLYRRKHPAVPIYAEYHRLADSPTDPGLPSCSSRPENSEDVVARLGV